MNGLLLKSSYVCRQCMQSLSRQHSRLFTRPQLRPQTTNAYQEDVPNARLRLHKHWSGDKKSWRPWLLGISIEYGARQLAKKDFQERLAGGLRGLTGLEREELRKRGWALGWWLMRGAFYENVTKYVRPVSPTIGLANYPHRSWIRGTASKLKGKMLLDIVGTVIEDYDYLWEEYYFSTATM